jgi:perosamine synthetase
MKNIPLFGVVSSPAMETAAVDVLRSGRIASGEYVARFESGLGALVGADNVVSTVDMTSALMMALHLAGVRQGDDVLAIAYACMSTNAAIAQCGARPVWVDVQVETASMDPDDVAKKITNATKAVILYHVAGYPGPAREIAALCRARGIAVIEDCDNALLATREDCHVGSHGDFAIYSFYPNRQINTTEGGALVCKDPAMAARARKLRRFGIDAASFRNSAGEINPASDIPEIGWAATMNNLCAALGCTQLSEVEERMRATRANAAELLRRLEATPEIASHVKVIAPLSGAQPAYWTLLLLVEQRDQVLLSMKKQGVHVSIMHQRNDIYSGFQQDAIAILPQTDYLQEHVMAIPCGWWLSEDDLGAIVTALQNALADSAL